MGAVPLIAGRSNIVGRPLANLLSSRVHNMTVTIGHSQSGPPLIELARSADLLVVAIGSPESVTAEWVKPGVARIVRENVVFGEPASLAQPA